MQKFFPIQNETIIKSFRNENIILKKNCFYIIEKKHFQNGEISIQYGIIGTISENANNEICFLTEKNVLNNENEFSSAIYFSDNFFTSELIQNQNPIVKNFNTKIFEISNETIINTVSNRTENSKFIFFESKDFIKNHNIICIFNAFENDIKIASPVYFLKTQDKQKEILLNFLKENFFIKYFFSFQTFLKNLSKENKFSIGVLDNQKNIFFLLRPKEELKIRNSLKHIPNFLKKIGIIIFEEFIFNNISTTTSYQLGTDKLDSKKKLTTNSFDFAFLFGNTPISSLQTIVENGYTFQKQIFFVS